MNRLRQKAADRNKDEFYFAMNRQKTEVRITNNSFQDNLLSSRIRGVYMYKAEETQHYPSIWSKYLKVRTKTTSGQ